VVRNGLNFTEREFGVRAVLGCYDGGPSAASQLRPGEVNWDAIFGRRGVRGFHCGGSFARLSKTTAELAIQAMQRRGGTAGIRESTHTRLDPRSNQKRCASRSASCTSVLT
jgi:hypothetical protein